MMIPDKRLTIIPGDGKATIDDKSYDGIVFNSYEEINAIQWRKNQDGEIEYIDRKRPNEIFTSFARISEALATIDAHIASIPPSPEHEETSPGVWAKSLRKVKDKKKREMQLELDQQLSSSMTCVVGAGDIYEVGGSSQDANDLKMLIDLAEAEGKNKVTVIGTSGEPYKNVKIEDAREIWQQQAVSIRTKKEKTADIIRKVEKDLTKVEDVESVVWE